MSSYMSHVVYKPDLEIRDGACPFCLAELSGCAIRLKDAVLDDSMTRPPLILPWLRDLQQKHSRKVSQ